MAQTTVILGAGASADFELPLGGELYLQAQQQLQSFIRSWDAAKDKDPFWDLPRVFRHFHDDPIALSLIEHLQTDKGLEVSPIYDLHLLMQEAPVYSIDTLALENPEYLDFCRVLVNAMITKSVQKNIITDQTKPERWKFSNRNITPLDDATVQIDNWIHLFTSMMRNKISADPSHHFNFISFNYDRIFERVLERIWKKPSRDLGALNEVSSFQYPHGSISWEFDQRGRSIFSPDKSKIVFAHNKMGKDTFKDARKFIENSDTLIALGFHFAQENTDSLDLRNTLQGKQMIFQNFDQNPSLTQRVSELDIELVTMFDGPIASAVLEGKLGALPS